MPSSSLIRNASELPVTVSSNPSSNKAHDPLPLQQVQERRRYGATFGDRNIRGVSDPTRFGAVESKA
jgi:hypothetical protein